MTDVMKDKMLTSPRATSKHTHKRHQSTFEPALRRQTVANLSPSNEQRLSETFKQEIQNPKSRVYQPTFKGFLAEQMSPQKAGFDNKPTVINSVTRVPGAVGWGIERKHLIADAKIITDDMRVPVWPVPKEHLAQLDNHKTA